MPAHNGRAPKQRLKPIDCIIHIDKSRKLTEAELESLIRVAAVNAESGGYWLRRVKVKRRDK